MCVCVHMQSVNAKLNSDAQVLRNSNIWRAKQQMEYNATGLITTHFEILVCFAAMNFVKRAFIIISVFYCRRTAKNSINFAIISNNQLES